MRLTYKLEKEDYYAFNFDQMKNIPRIRRNINIQRFLIPVVFSLIALLLVRLNKKEVTSLSPLYFILVFGWIIIYPQILKRSISQRLQKVLNSDENQMLFEERTIEINHEGLYAVVEKEGKEDLLLAAEKVEKLEENNDYIYIFLSSQSVYIVPKKFFSNQEELEKFRVEIESIVQEKL